MKSRKGYVYQEKKGIWYARFTYTDNSGTRRNVKRRAENKTRGEKVLKKLIQDFDTGGIAQLDADKITFNELCDFYEKHYVSEAKYVNNRKVSGLRSAATVRGYLKVFREYFGRQKLKAITCEHLRTYRNERLGTSTHQSKQRSLSTVNRALQIAGVIKMITARILLFVAWLIATISVAAFLNNAPFEHRAIVAVLFGLPVAIILFLLERWITKTVSKREAEQNAKPNSIAEVKTLKEKRTASTYYILKWFDS